MYLHRTTATLLCNDLPLIIAIFVEVPSKSFTP